MRKGIESWKQILTSVLLNELFHTEYVTRSYSFSLLFSFFSIHLLFGKAMPRSRNQYSGVATLQGYLTSVSIQGSIYLMPPFFYRLCQRISAASF